MKLDSSLSAGSVHTAVVALCQCYVEVQEASGDGLLAVSCANHVDLLVSGTIL